MKRFLLVLGFLLGLQGVVWGQVINASIDADEYGAGNSFNFGSGGATWHMTWDDNYLYVAVINANQTETATIYLDFDPLEVANGGDNSNGSLTGSSFDFYTPNLPFRADAALFAKNDYRQISTANGSGGWNISGSGNGAFSATADDYSAGFVAFNDNGNGNGTDDRREFKVAWTRMGLAGKPASFNFLGYISYDNSAAPSDEGIYAAIPSENPTGNIASTGATPNLSRYFKVNSTAILSTPFDRNSYTHLAGSTNIGSLAVYEFNLNENITVGINAGAEWDITHLRINQGTVNLNNADRNIDIFGNIVINTGASLILSNNFGNDLYLGGNFTNNGIFNCNERAVFLNGTGEQIIGGASTSTFDFLILDKSSGEVKLEQNLNIDDNLRLDEATNTADLDLNGFDIHLLNASVLTEDRANSKVVKDLTATDENNPGGSIIATARAVGNGSFVEIAGLGLFIQDNGHSVDVSRQHYRADQGKGIKKIYHISVNSGTPASILLQLHYAADELAGIATGDLQIFRYSVADFWEAKNSTGGAGFVQLSNPETAYSSWTLGDQNSPLPINLVHFEAKRLNAQSVELFWQTASEQNNLGFEIEKSADALHFEKIGFVEGAGNATSIRSYRFGDQNAVSSAYYRLKQIDHDGKISYSGLRFVEAGEGYSLLSVYPNPFTEHVHLQSGEEILQDLELYDSQGRVIWQYQQGGDIKQAEQLLNTYLKHLPKGNYLLKVRLGTQQETKRLLKH